MKGGVNEQGKEVGWASREERSKDKGWGEQAGTRGGVSKQG